jgi:hypothetical protein
LAVLITQIFESIIGFVERVFDTLALTFARRIKTHITFVQVLFLTGFSKVLVVHGSLKSRESERIEIIDLETSGTTCSPIQDLPLESENLYGAVGHLFSNDIPVICGGYTTYVYHSECYKFEDGSQSNP